MIPNISKHKQKRHALTPEFKQQIVDLYCGKRKYDTIREYYIYEGDETV